VTVIKDVNIPPKLWSKTIPVNYALQEVIETLSKDLTAKRITSECICKKHDKLIEFYCADENTLCCSFCAINKLKEGKEVTEINQVAKAASAERNKSLQKQIYDLLLKTNNAKHFLDTKEMELETQILTIDEELNNVQESIIKKMENSKAVIMSKANFLKQEILKKYALQRRYAEKLTEDLEQMRHTFNTAVECKAPEHTFILLQSLEEKVRHLDDKIKTHQEQMSYSDITFSVDKMVNIVLDDANLSFGKLIENEVKPVVSDLTDSRKVKLRKIVILDVLTSRSDEKQPLYSGMDFLPDGRLALVDNANWKCLILSRKLEVIGKHQFSSHIFDIVATSNNELFVTGAKRLENVLIDSEKGFARVESFSLESCPFSICKFNDDRFVIGTYRSSIPARILSKSGREFEFSVDFPEKYWKIDDSRCTYDDDENILVLTDRYENCVYIYDTRINSEIRVKDKRILEPRGVAFGPHGSIFVCSRGTNSIVQLSRYGEVLGNHLLDMIYPCTICFSKDKKKVAISNSYAEAKQLQIFQLCSVG
jgi:hypothetical protein